MKTSAAGRALITQREGRKLAAYRDQKGVLTIGVGHTGRMSPPPVTAGMRITDDQCDEFLARDLAPVEAVINGAVKVPMTQDEFDALASLGFNIGAGGLKTSTVIRKLNLGDVQGAANAILLWNKPANLLKRRQEERAQFLKPDPSPASAATFAGARADALKTNAAAVRQAAGDVLTGSGILAVSGAAATGVAVASSPGAGVLALALAPLVAAGIGVIHALLSHVRASTMTANADAIQARSAA